jgi:TetR/AcrR family transcriptional regulator
VQRQRRGAGSATDVEGTARGQATRERLLAISAMEFATRGFAGARIAVIARKAGVSNQSLYYYFHSKKELFREVIGYRIEAARELSAVLEAPATFREWLRQLPRRNVAVEARTWLRLLAWEALELEDEEIIREHERRRALWNARVAEVERAQAQGELTSTLEPRMLALAISAIEMMPLLLSQVTKMLTDMAPESAEFQRAHEALFEALAEQLRPRAD